MKQKRTKLKRTTWTFEPDKSLIQIVEESLIERTELINQALTQMLKSDLDGVLRDVERRIRDLEELKALIAGLPAAKRLEKEREVALHEARLRSISSPAKGVSLPSSEDNAVKNALSEARKGEAKRVSAKRSK